MRAVTIEGTKAFFSNVRGINNLPKGEGPDAHLTAPFNVVWQANEMMGPVVRLRDTVIAQIDLRKNPNQLIVRDGVPESCDFAIVRAVQNAATFMKQEAARKRADSEKKPNAAERFFDPNPDNGEDLILEGWDVARLITAATGAQKASPRMIASAETYRQGVAAQIYVPHGNSYKSLYCRTTPTGMVIVSGVSGLNAEALRRTLEKGDQDWEELVRSGRFLRSLLGMSDMRYDRESLLKSFLESKLFPPSSASFEVGDFSISGGEVKFEGMRIAHLNWGTITNPIGREAGTPGSGVLFPSTSVLISGSETEALFGFSDLMATLAMRILGKTPEDFPPINGDELHDLVMGIDYGYLG